MLNGFFSGNSIDLAGLAYVADNTTATYSTDTGLLQITAGTNVATLYFGAGDSAVADPFHATADGSGGTLITNDAVQRSVIGTRIETPDGWIAIEQLVAGDLVKTVSGRVRPIIWAGSRTIEPARYPNADLRPVRLRAYAFAYNVPFRDVLLSPDHAIYVDGFLIPAKHLINGSSVTRQAVTCVIYHHFELDSHDVVLADNLPTETYLEHGDGMSLKSNDLKRLHWLPRNSSSLVWEAHGYAPLCITGEGVERVRERLVQRHEAMASTRAETHRHLCLA